VALIALFSYLWTPGSFRVRIFSFNITLSIIGPIYWKVYGVKCSMVLVYWKQNVLDVSFILWILLFMPPSCLQWIMIIETRRIKLVNPQTSLHYQNERHLHDCNLMA
jgi:hypothetical protein